MLCKEFSLWLVESVNAEFMDTDDQLSISDSLATPKILYWPKLEPEGERRL